MGTETTIEPLTDQQRAVLEFERLRWKHPGLKDQQVLKLFGLSPARYALLVQHLITLPAAEVYDPQTVRRLQRLRDQRRAHRRGATQSTPGQPAGKWSTGIVGE